jgi:isoquinoline 1-oxidoreductase subunit beta
MTKHQKIDALPFIDRRSFIVGTAAAGLVIGYAAPKIGETLAATAANAEPSIWASISPDGKVWVTVGKADMG